MHVEGDPAFSRIGDCDHKPGSVTRCRRRGSVADAELLGEDGAGYAFSIALRRDAVQAGIRSLAWPELHGFRVSCARPAQQARHGSQR